MLVKNMDVRPVTATTVLAGIYETDLHYGME